MMKKSLLLVAAVIGCSLFASCGTTQQPLYSWYDSEDVSYEYNKTHSDEMRASLLKEYQKMEAHQQGTRGTVPPGFYAEYGYALVAAGQREEGLAKLRKELELYPESKVFVERIIKQIEQQ